MRQTPYETNADARERAAFNAAFRELGLRWHWDAAAYAELKDMADDELRVQAYLERHQSHLLKAYDAQFLVGAVCAAKERAAADLPASRVLRPIDCADFAAAQTGF